MISLMFYNEFDVLKKGFPLQLCKEFCVLALAINVFAVSSIASSASKHSKITFSQCFYNEFGVVALPSRVPTTVL